MWSTSFSFKSFNKFKVNLQCFRFSSIIIKKFDSKEKNPRRGGQPMNPTHLPTAIRYILLLYETKYSRELKQTTSLQFFYRLSSTKFTLSTLEYFVPYTNTIYYLWRKVRLSRFSGQNINSWRQMLFWNLNIHPILL